MGTSYEFSAEAPDPSATYATVADFRRLTHFRKDSITDQNLYPLINRANEAVVKLVTGLVYLEKLKGDIDGSNKQFKVDKTPIADTNYDENVDGSDVTVYFATYDPDTNFLEYGSQQTVSSVQSNDGIIVMDSAPTESSAEAGVYAIYRYYVKTDIDFDQIKLAANYYLAFLVANKLQGNVPDWSLVTASYLRRDLTGADWLKLVYQTLGIENQEYFTRAEGVSI